MKITAFVGISAAAIGILIGNQLPRGLVNKPVSITTFKIQVPFDQWVAGFDSKGSDRMHKAKDITPLFRGVNINDPTQVVVIHQSKPGVVEKLLIDNKEKIRTTGHLLRTTRTTNWSFD